MNRDIFKKISRLRVEEAKTLLENDHYHGAYYLIGYAVECALKACVAKQVKRYDFPDKKLANEAFTHNLSKLIKIAGLSPEFERARQENKELDVSWAIVKDWSEVARYDTDITKTQAEDLYNACVSRKHGVLTWIRKKW